MGWNKNTIDISEVGAIVRTLELLKEPYDLREIGTVPGRGLNDTDGTTYRLHRLAFRDTVVLERMLRSYDCDFDDFLESFIFSKETEPSDWECVIVDDDEWEKGQNLNDEYIQQHPQEYVPPNGLRLPDYLN